VECRFAGSIQLTVGILKHSSEALPASVMDIDISVFL